MSRTGVVVAIACWLGAAVPAAAGEWSLGAHLGMGVVESDVSGAGSTNFVAWPANPVLYQPGLRVAFGDRRRANELLGDTGFLLLDEGGSTLSLLATAFSLQHAWRGSWRNSPFLNVGIGFLRETSEVRSSVSTTYGAGFGLRHRVREDHGALRVEARVDHVPRDEELGRPALTTVGLRLGFDLWL
jgi:hypothetical protein